MREKKTTNSPFCGKRIAPPPRAHTKPLILEPRPETLPMDIRIATSDVMAAKLFHTY